jgi:hypothetical protein
MVASIDIYNHPDWFYCDTLRSWMRRAQCVAYQRMARDAGDPGKVMLASVAQDRVFSCLECAQGRDIARNAPKTNPKTRNNRKGAQTMEIVNNPPPYADDAPVCTVCGRPAVSAKGTPMRNNLCPECYAEKRRANTAKKAADKATSAAPAPLKHPCKRCGEREVMTDRKGNLMPSGVCNVCFSDVLREAKERKQHKVELDFNPYPQVLTAIKERATAQFRTLQAQIMWDLIHNAGRATRK